MNIQDNGGECDSFGFETTDFRIRAEASDGPTERRIPLGDAEMCIYDEDIVERIVGPLYVV